MQVKSKSEVEHLQERTLDSFGRHQDYCIMASSWNNDLSRYFVLKLLVEGFNIVILKSID